MVRKSVIKTGIFVGVLFALLFTVRTEGNNPKEQEPILGKWWMPDRSGQLEIFKCKNTFCGKIVWIDKIAYDSAFDLKNPVDSLRNRSLIGLQIMSDFKQTKKNVWTGGTFYMPKEGKTVSPVLTLLDSNRLNVKITFFIFSKSVVLQRVNEY